LEKDSIQELMSNQEANRVAFLDVFKWVKARE